MKTEIVLVTPSLAAKWLSATTSKNRPMKPEALRQYIQSMRSGKWRENGESIVIDDNGNILDGQHRLQAVVSSGMSFRFAVIRGVDPDSFDTIDSGVRRTGKDVLTIAGYADGSTLAAVLSAIHRYYSGCFGDTRSPGSNERGPKHIRADYMEWIAAYPDAVESASYIHSRSKRCLLFKTVSFAGCMHYVFGQQSKPARDEFFDAIYERIYSNGRRCPIRKLQKAYENTVTSKRLYESVKYRSEVWQSAFHEYQKAPLLNATFSRRANQANSRNSI